MGVPKSPLGVIGIIDGVCISMMYSMSSTPPLRGSFQCPRSRQKKSNRSHRMGFIGFVSKEAVVSSSDADTGYEVVKNREVQSRKSESDVAESED